MCSTWRFSTIRLPSSIPSSLKSHSSARSSYKKVEIIFHFSFYSFIYSLSFIYILIIHILAPSLIYSLNYLLTHKFTHLFCLLVDLEWKVVYVGNHEDNAYDQVLEELSVGPVPVGVNRFVLQTSVGMIEHSLTHSITHSYSLTHLLGPNANNILNEHLIGVTVILLSCSYMNQKFVEGISSFSH